MKPLDLLQLYKIDEKEFFKSAESSSQYVYINEGCLFKIFYANSSFIEFLDTFKKDLYHKNFSFSQKYLDQDFLHHNLTLLKNHNYSSQPNSACHYVQRIKSRGKWHYIFTRAYLIEKGNYLNFSYSLNELGNTGQFFHEMLDKYIVSQNGIQKYHSLTEREKQVLKMLVKYQNEEIAEKLYVSVLTVKTHRKAISRKLDVHSLPELIRYAIAFELL